MRRLSRLLLACVATVCLRYRPAFVVPPSSRTGRRFLLGAAISGSLKADAKAQSLTSMEKWDGSFLDTSKDCKEDKALGTPEGTCLRNINALGGYATIRGRDGPSGEEWEVFAEYDGSEIILPFKERGGSKAVGKWFSNKKLGVKGIKFADDTVWEKMEYKIYPAPNEMSEAIQQERNEAKAKAAKK
ncbi:unnamed protein product [Effrenium voratum]|nr:unnamed protein product [Effrenium voratum]